mgnify:CR=1 FL=1
MTEETKIRIAVWTALFLLVAIGVMGMISRNTKQQEKEDYISRHKYFVTVPDGKYPHTYYTNEYKEENGILYFVVDGKKMQHKGEYTLGENK